MTIIEFLDNNPTFSESDVDFCLIDGQYDAVMLRTFDENVNRADRHAIQSA